MVVMFIKTFQNSRSKDYKKSAGYILNRYAKECDVIKLGWLPIIERFEFSTTKVAFKALHCPEWPDYLPLKSNQIN